MSPAERSKLYTSRYSAQPSKMSADTTSQSAAIDVGSTVLSEDQVRAMLNEYGQKPKWSLDGSTLKDVAEALDIPVPEAAELLRKAQAKPPEKPQTPKTALLLNNAALVLSFTGIFIAGTLSAGHLLEKAVPCGDSGGCDTVTSTAASMIAGIPVAYLGFSAYILLALISGIRAIRGLGKTGFLGSIALGASGIGALFSFYLQYVSFTQIHAVCYWCLSSALVMCLLFLVQAGLAQLEVPKDGEHSGGGALIFTVGLALLVSLGLGYQTLQLNKQPTNNLNKFGSGIAVMLITPDSLKLGPDSAPIKLVEFSDLVCPTCQAYYQQVKDLVNNSHGKIQLIFRNRPLTHNPEHKMALPAAFYCSYAQDHGLGWQFVDEMYKHDNPDLQTEASIEAIAKKVGINVEDANKHKHDNDPEYLRVANDLQTAEKLQIDTTPTFVILTVGYLPDIKVGSEVFTELKQSPYAEIINGK